MKDAERELSRKINQIAVEVSVRVDFEELQRRLNRQQIQAFMRGVAEVIAASKKAHRPSGPTGG